jgi:CRISPR/Cas system CMR subunit Cmr4 (Cas7 group RAMP superfamily)
MSESEWFIVPNIKEFTDKARAIVYNNFGSWHNKADEDVFIDDVKDNEKEEFDKVLSFQESLVIVKENLKKERHKITKKTRYILNDDMFAQIVNKLNERMVSNIISGLVQKGLVESAFDEQANDFIFWVKNDTEENEKPETD